MENSEPRPRVKLPEAEAVKLAALIRGRVSTMPITLSVFAFIGKSGKQGLNIQVDYANPETLEVETYDMNYKASEDAFQICRHALKRIKHKFDL